MTVAPPPLLEWAHARQILTPREFQVLRLWRQGVGIRKTGTLLGIGESTVRTHRDRILRAVGDHGPGLDDVRVAC